MRLVGALSNASSLTIDPERRAIELRIGSEDGRNPRRHALAGVALTVVGGDFVIGQKVPGEPEREVVGAATTIIARDSAAFAALRENRNPTIVFKDEEKTSADRMMTVRLGERLDALAALVTDEWPGTKLRVTESWDENLEHGQRSVHYEARAVDLTTFPVDGSKLGRLARLAVNAGLDWVFFENALHVHASVTR